MTRGGKRAGAGREAGDEATVTRSFRLPSRLLAALEQLAVRKRSTVNALVRDALEALFSSAPESAPKRPQKAAKKDAR
jgi:predicted transcriptional regulator